MLKFVNVLFYFRNKTIFVSNNNKQLYIMNELHRDYTPSNELIDYLGARVKALEIENERLIKELDKVKSLIVY